jgi:O-antigen/teichoic acid export membrane protein
MNAALPARAVFVGTVGTGFAIQALTFLIGILTARLLGPEGRGLLAGAILWPSIFAAVATLGTHQMLSLRAAEPGVDRNDLVSRGVALALLLSVLGIAVGWLLLPLLLPDNEEEILTLGRLFLLFIPLNILVSQFQAIDLGGRSIRRLNLTRLTLSPVHLFFVCALWALTWTEVLHFVMALLIANAITLAWRWSKESASSVRPRFDVRWMRAMICDSRQFFLTNVGYLLQTQLDRIFILWMLPVENLGVYVVALGCAGAHLTVTRSLGLVVFARGAGMTLQAAMDDFARLFRHAVVMSVALSVIVVALLPFAVPLLFGSAFGTAVLPAMILVLGNLFGSLASLTDDALRAQAKPMPGFQGRFLGSSVFLGLAFIFHSELGIIGVAVASAISQTVFLAWMVRRIRMIAPNHLAPGFSDVAAVGHDVLSLLRRQSITGRSSV